MQSINILFVFGRSLLENCSLALDLSVKKKKKSVYNKSKFCLWLLDCGVKGWRRHGEGYLHGRTNIFCSVSVIMYFSRVLGNWKT